MNIHDLIHRVPCTGNLHPSKPVCTPSLEQHLGLLEHLIDIGISIHITRCHPQIRKVGGFCVGFLLFVFTFILKGWPDDKLQ